MFPFLTKRSESQAQHGSLAARRALFGGNDENARLQVSADDFGVGIVVEAECDRDGNWLAVAKDPDLALIRSAARGGWLGRFGLNGSCSLAFGQKAQRLIWNANDVASLIDDDACRSRHARFQRQVGIIYADHDIVGHHVLYRLRRLAYLHHFADEGPLRECINGE